MEIRIRNVSKYYRSSGQIIKALDRGRIIEIGSPRKIYFNATHSFVVDFIGRTNLIEAAVTSQEGAVTTVSCALGSIVCRKQANMKPGDSVTLCLRPEFIRLKRGDAARVQNVFNGRIESLVFIGEAFEGEIAIDDSRLFIKTEPDSEIGVGDSVNFTVEPDHCLLVSR